MESVEMQYIGDVYRACNRLLKVAPPVEDDDEYEEIYAEAKNFMDAVDAMGLEF